MKLDNIVITGGAGFIGSNTAIALQKLGLKVTIIDNFDEQAGANYSNIIDIKEREIAANRVSIEDLLVRNKAYKDNA